MQNQIQIKAADAELMGRYANNVNLAFTAEEFVFDFMLLSPSGAQLVSRIIASPGHAKRIAKHLDENVARYEADHGKIKEADAAGVSMGFRTPEN